MIRLILMYTFLLFGFISRSQEKSRLYDPKASPEKDLAKISEKAKKENKHILILAGGNWCARCLTFDEFCLSNKEIDSIMKSDFLLYHLNYSEENENKLIFTKFGYPQRFGFPVLLILNEKGERIHIQESEYLEQGMSYSKRRVYEFLLAWNRKSIQPEQYK
jgi:thiol:disulfide interchange protein